MEGSQLTLYDIYRKVASSNTSRLETHAGFFRLLMKGICTVTFDKKLIYKLVTHVRTRDYTVLFFVSGNAR